MPALRRALVVEGGGMKAAYANGVLSAFEEAGFRPWSAVYGASAGGALAAWYSAGQAVYAEGTWAYARDPGILSYSRFVLRRGPLLDHDGLIDRVYAHEHPLDLAALGRSPHPVIVTASDVRTGQAHYQDLREGDALSWLKATGRLPFASGAPVPVGGALYLDGGITDPIPVRKAAADGHTNVTVVLNAFAGDARRDNPVLAKMTARRFPALRDGILRHDAVKREAVAWAESPPAGVRVRIVRPNRPTGLHRLSRDMEVIRQAIAQGRRDGRAFLAREGGTNPEAVSPTSGLNGME
ncbi:MAG: patatin family protein [Thermoplasmatota archaeon]|nr:patatin family protein [Halobacteriales archaeon]